MSSRSDCSCCILHICVYLFAILWHSLPNCLTCFRFCMTRPVSSSITSSRSDSGRHMASISARGSPSPSAKNMARICARSASSALASSTVKSLQDGERAAEEAYGQREVVVAARGPGKAIKTTSPGGLFTCSSPVQAPHPIAPALFFPMSLFLPPFLLAFLGPSPVRPPIQQHLPQCLHQRLEHRAG